MTKLKIKDYPTVGYSLRTSWSSVVKYYSTIASTHNSTMPIGLALVSIDPENGNPSTSLGPKIGMEPTSLSRTLKKLEEDGYIERFPNPNDGRSVIVKLTESGKEIHKIAKKSIMDLNEKILSNLSEEKIKIFHEVCNTIQNTANEMNLELLLNSKKRD